MSEIKDDDFTNLYQKIYFQNTDDPIKNADILRKCTVLDYTASLSSLENLTSLQLLKTNLNDLAKAVNTISGNIYDERLRNLLQGKELGEIQSNLHKIDVKSLLTKLPCSSTDFICHKSENVSVENYQEFVKLFNQKRTPKESVSEPKQRTFAKRFAPQTCNTKERKISKPPSFNAFDNLISNEAQSCSTSTNSEGLKSEAEVKSGRLDFKTAREELNVQRKVGKATSSVGGGQKRKLGARRGLGGKFVSPMLSNNDSGEENSKSQEWEDQVIDERLKNLDPNMVTLIKSEIMDTGPGIDWNDIAGLEFAKSAIQEAVVWPMLRPDIFTGLRKPPKGILLFGPPGTGKTLIGKCVASQSKSTFFSISASSLTSKWVGDGEKMVRALFAVARCCQPAVIFIDEIDSLLSQRSETEHESSIRIKTEFLIQLDGATTDSDERLLVIGATNRPQALDEAARRRFVKRLYIPLPELKARFQLVQRLMCGEKHNLTEENMMEVARGSDGYSGADMKNLCSDASLGPIRSIDMSMIQSIQTSEVRPVLMDDFIKALCRVKSSVAPSDLEQYVKWDKTYGSGSFG